jgi:hypothetical protein
MLVCIKCFVEFAISLECMREDVVIGFEVGIDETFGVFRVSVVSELMLQ